MKNLTKNTQYQFWIEGFTRDLYLEEMTARSFLSDSLGGSQKPFSLEDWIPEEYLDVG